jgi:hypothetical protein
MHEPIPANPDLFRPLKDGRINQVERFFHEQFIGRAAPNDDISLMVLRRL